MFESIREEAEIFKDLEELCKSPGYIHVIAYFSFRDNFYRVSDNEDGEVNITSNTEDFLVRPEINTLIALALKGDFITELPSPKTTNLYLRKTIELLHELHFRLTKGQFDTIKFAINHKDKEYNPLQKGSVLREAIFYGSESAYSFQFEDLSLKKYKNDNEWFEKNKGYSVEQGLKITSALVELQSKKALDFLNSCSHISPDHWTALSIFQFTLDELVGKTKLDKIVVKLFVESFTYPQDLDINQFNALDDFNPITAYPFIKLEDNNYLLIQCTYLHQALYETPFFWFYSDKNYKSKLAKNRGEFTEQFSEERLAKVFGKEKVFTNVNIYLGKHIVGEIDVLVIFGNRAIVLQAKSKKLTISARKGNDNSLKDDFKKAIHDAYDQCYLCAEYLLDERCKFDIDGKELVINKDYKEIYPICIVSDHYPALAAQAEAFLNFKTTKEIMPPFVMDVFFLDVLSELLESPLYFLSYLNRRVKYSEKINPINELAILGYHLKQNLWLDDFDGNVIILEDFAEEIDHAMHARRRGFSDFPSIPEGILTKFKGTLYDKLLSEIIYQDNPVTIDLGFLLLQLSEETIENLNSGLLQAITKTKIDEKKHDLSLGFGGSEEGLTIHCWQVIDQERLKEHCKNRKYISKAKKWYGLIINPDTLSISYYTCLEYDWMYSPDMEMIADYIRAQHVLRANSLSQKKIGRNDPCPCGSGKKYKKCCLHRAT